MLRPLPLAVVGLWASAAHADISAQIRDCARLEDSVSVLPASTAWPRLAHQNPPSSLPPRALGTGTSNLTFLR